MPQRPLVSIQYLRAIAALMVLGYHACRWAWRDFDIGAAGVDVFFVISGFILWTIAAERPTMPGAFLARRAARVVPLYWLTTFAVAAAATVWPRLFFDAKPTVEHLVLSLFFLPHLNPQGLPFPVISAGWSLNYEAVFYLVFAWALLGTAENRFRRLATGLSAVLAFGLIVRPAYYLGFNLMFMQFLAGAWLARRRLSGPMGERQTGWLLFAAGVIGFAVLSGFDLFEAILRPVYWGVPAFAMVAGLVMVEDAGGLPKLSWLKFLGDASYSIYLVHVVATEALTHVMNAGRPIYVPVAVAVSLTAGIGCHLFVEKPLIGLFRARPRAALPSGAI